ncbi:hypothetical protein OIU85_002116, partial [Salix viminalis]
KFQAEKGLESQKRSSIGTTADCKAQKKVDAEVDLRALKDVLAHVASQIIEEEQEYLAEEKYSKSRSRRSMLTFRGRFHWWR